jgi:hypothetical protein
MLSELKTIQINFKKFNESSIELTDFIKTTRVSSFKLEALGRLYLEADHRLDNLKNDFKELEDQVGLCKKWLDLNSPNLKNCQKDISKLIKRWKADRVIENYIFITQKLNFSEKETLSVFKKELKNEIKTIENNKYDFTFGETGLHELRRNIRWPKIYIEIFAGNLAITSESTCPNSTLYQLGLSEIQLEFQTEDEQVLVLDNCQYHKLLGAIEKLGLMKDELESAGDLEDKLPKNIKEDVEDLFLKLKKEILPKLISKI